ncbi:MAG: KTSC domain-containing protein [Egibacteraceae bacterium]
MQRIPVISTMLASVGYDPTTRTLEAEFTSGAVYRYSDVPPETYEGLMAADSHGRYFNAHIRDRYRYDRVT